MLVRYQELDQRNDGQITKQLYCYNLITPTQQLPNGCAHTKLLARLDNPKERALRVDAKTNEVVFSFIYFTLDTFHLFLRFCIPNHNH